MVAIDWPGHGLSSPRPVGSYYHMINYVTDLRYVIDGMYRTSITCSTYTYYIEYDMFYYSYVYSKYDVYYNTTVRDLTDL